VTHTHTRTRHTQPPPNQTASTFKKCVFLFVWFQLVSISGRRKAEIVCEFIHSSIHPSHTRHCD